MGLKPAPEPLGLQDAVAKRYRRKVVLKDIKALEYSSQVRPLWNGTVYTYELSGRQWPKQVYVFPMLKADGPARWKAYPHGPIRYRTPEEAVKAALREEWAAEISFEI